MARTTGAGRHDLSRVPEPPGGFPSVPTSIHNTARTLTPVAVVDVYDARRRQRALARIDLLDRERRDRTLDEASYLVGREVERVFEQMTRVSGGGQWCEGDRLDPATQAEVAAILGIERAHMVNAFLGWLVRHIGQRDTVLLWRVLGLRWSFGVAAVAAGRLDRRGKRYTIDRFRDALAVLAEAKAAKGRELRR
jgi:hypothetical protein